MDLDVVIQFYLKMYNYFVKVLMFYGKNLEDDIVDITLFYLVIIIPKNILSITLLLRRVLFK